MYNIIVTRDDKVNNNIECKAFSLSYINKDGEVVSVVSADEDTQVSDMSILGCSNASAVLRAINIVSEGKDTSDIQAPKMDTSKDVQSFSLLSKID